MSFAQGLPWSTHCLKIHYFKYYVNTTEGIGARDIIIISTCKGERGWYLFLLLNIQYFRINILQSSPDNLARKKGITYELGSHESLDLISILLSKLSGTDSIYIFQITDVLL